MTELHSYELILNGGQQVQKGKANLAVAFSSHEKRNKAKKKAKTLGLPKVEKKKPRKPKNLSNFKCFFFEKKGQFKVNCKEWKGYQASKVKGMKLFVIETCLMED
ncbi:hypothetical protein PVK06_004676 [Gossypium arboreum]|uniref:Uncharacterized protein n=1 Tax=Gossypium arboreum TaxID=29729 RepID=A0ABR0QSM7_GOSAR|nr:hypothetical protein PVK06_004676 [Gossypium arboreum]